VKFEATDVRVLCAREIFTRFLGVAKLLKGMVTRDGIEPPTPAFQGRLPNRLSGLKSTDVIYGKELMP
jgi:hypothetical protein